MKNLLLFGALTLVLAGCDSAPSDVAMANTATGDGDTTNATNSASTSTLNVASENTPADLASNTPPDATTGLSTESTSSSTPPLTPSSTSGSTSKSISTPGKTQGTTPPVTVPPAPPTADGTVGAKAGDDVAVLETTQGRIVFAFLPAKAPKHVENFKTLTKKGFYNGTAFHRVIPGFMIQGGDPNSKKGAQGMMGMGGPGYQIKAEFNDTPHVRGVVSMARTNEPDSAGSQFYIVVADSNFLDNQYTAFGRVLSGMEVADKLVGLDRDQEDKPTDIEKARVKTVRIAKWPVK